MSEDNVSPYASLFTDPPQQGGPTSSQPGGYTPTNLVANPLDLPLYGAGPIVSTKRFLQNYAKFSGRASRSEYWWPTLLIMLAYLALSGAGVAAGFAFGGGVVDEYGVRQPGPAFLPFFAVALIVVIGSIIPSIAVGIRRLHDGGFSGTWYLVNFVPYIGSFVLVVFFVLPPKPEGARYDRVNGLVPAYAQPQQPPNSPYAALPPQPSGQRPPTPGA